MTIFWSYGGGVQSRAIAALIVAGRLPMPDLVAIADTGREVKATWEFIDQHLRPAGFTIHVIPHEYATVDLYGTNGDLLIPAFTRSGAGVGKFPTYCSNEWKQRACRRWLKDQGVNDCDAWLGISTNEIERMKPSGVNWYRHVYPLIELVPTSRAQCEALLTGQGWPLAKSRCWMCPNQSARDWQNLRDQSPAEFQQAVAFDAELRLTDANVYVHRLALPLAEAVEKSDEQPGLFDGCDSGYCMV